MLSVDPLPGPRSLPAAYPLLERDPERELIARAQAGDRAARDGIVTSHLRLVRSVARAHARRGVSAEDLFGEGVCGLLEALDRFDLGRDNRFSTYATYWVRERIARHARQQRTMVAPPDTRSARIVLRGRQRAQRNLVGRLGREPSRAELAEALGVTDDDVATCEAAFLAHDVALDGFAADDPRAHVMTDAASPEHRFAVAEESAFWRHRLASALSELPQRERFIVERRFLVDEEEEQSLTELGSVLGISRERARQLQETGRARLRRSLADAAPHAP